MLDLIAKKNAEEQSITEVKMSNKEPTATSAM